MLRRFIVAAGIVLVGVGGADAHAKRHHYRHGKIAHEEKVPLPTARPKQIEGILQIMGHGFKFVSGGAGWSIPYGDHEITPDEVGHWGARHGAIGLSHGEIKDPVLGRTREGIEIHAAHGSATSGCVGIKGGFQKLKNMVLAMIEQTGHAWLHVWATGATGISSSKEWVPQPIQVAEKDDGIAPKARTRQHKNHYARTQHRRHPSVQVYAYSW